MRTYLLVLASPLITLVSCSDFGSPLTQTQKSSNEPVVEVIMGCMDKVSIGGTLRVVVNSQTEYDQLMYDRFTRPLQEYWNAHYDSTLALIRRLHPGLSDEEYARLVRQAFYSAYPFRGTDSCSVPTINFSTSTLLGQDARAGGCRPPTYELTVLRNDSAQTVTYKVQISQHGGCDIAWNRNEWIVTRKIPGNYSVQFEKEYIRN